jgi:hypothetical protein
MDPEVDATLLSSRNSNTIIEAQADGLIEAASAGSVRRIGESEKRLQFAQENVDETGHILMGDFNSTSDVQK